MKVALAQNNFHVGNFDSNFEKIQARIQEAKTQKADIIVFPELAITGYPPRDFLEFESFIDQCEMTLDQVKALSQDIGIIIGSPRRNNGKGKRLFNSAFFFYNLDTLHIQDKFLLPTYDIFDEVRYFEPAKDFKTVSFKGNEIAISICEDIWNIGDNGIYQESPLDFYSSFDISINIAASPFSFNQLDRRINIVQENAKKYKTPFFYCNHTGAQTELIFDGSCMHANSNGELVTLAPQFEEGLYISETNQEINAVQKESKYNQIEKALVTGIKDYFQKLGFKKAVIGLSGGIDSALTFALACKAIGPDNVHGILMPSQYSSDHSIQDALDLAKNLGANSDTIEIKPLFEAFEKSLDPIFQGAPYDVTEENLQARIRGVLLMAYSNKKGNIVLNTSNKSEAAVGYGTLYGDMCGGLSVLGDLYKTEVFALSRHMNKDGIIIPENTINKPPSAELRPDQKDSDSLPDYEVLDRLLFEYIENRQGSQQLIDLGFEKALVERVIRLVNMNEYKRYQTAPTLRMSDKAFGMGRRLPIAAKFSV